jgi:FOG: HEAT repeat
MKKTILAFICLCVLCGTSIAQNASLTDGHTSNNVPDSGESASAAQTSDSQTEALSGIQKAKGGTAVVPAAKRPAAPDKEKAELAAADDDSPGAVKEYSDTLQFGISPEIIELLQKFITNDDPRFVDQVYDLFQTTKSTAVRDKIVEYFTHFKDPCIEDYAVTTVNDPYDIKSSSVSLVFTYISAVKCTAAVPAIISLLDSDNETYFQDALTALGNIGGPSEALYLADYLNRDDLSVPQKQQLAQVLGKINAVETWQKLAELAQNKDENSFVRMYSAESIGEMKKTESVPILTKLYEETDPNLRQYVIKGLENYPGNKDAESVIIQALRDEHYKVRLEAVSAVQKLLLKTAVPYLIYRTKAASEEQTVKNACYQAIAAINTSEGNEYLVGILTDKKTGDAEKGKAAEALFQDNNAGEKEILSLAEETLKDDKRKQLRYTIGKQLAKYARPSYAEICRDFISSKDAATVSLGLDMYRKGKYQAVSDTVQSVAHDKNAGGNGRKARKILGLPEDIPSDPKDAAAKDAKGKSSAADTAAEKTAAD